MKTTNKEVEMRTSVDIVIVNYNSTDHLLQCLGSIYDSLQELPVRIFVQDNASMDNVERVTSAFPHVSLKKNRCNIGFSKAVNRGLQQGSAPYVVLLNPDTTVQDGLFKSAVAFMEENPEVGILGPRILNTDGSIQGSARGFPTPLTAFFGRNSLLTRVFPGNRITRENILTTKSDGKTPMEVDWVSGACMLVRREAVEDVGLMDERFFMYWEDADWCRRMLQKDWKVSYFPQASILHYVGVSSEHLLFRSIFEFHKSIYWLFHKYNKPFLRILEPVVIGGLSFRISFMLVSSGLNVYCRRPGLAARRKAAALITDKESKIKVLRIIARLNIGGPAIHVHLLTKGLDGNRFKSILVTGKISPQEGDMGYLFDPKEPKPLIIPELQREISLKMDLRALLQILVILRREKPDIVHTHTAKAGTSARIVVFLYNLISRRNVKMAHTFHGHIFEGYFNRSKAYLFTFIERLLGKITDVIIAISESQKKELAEKYCIAPLNKFKVINLGFNLNPFVRSKVLRGQYRESIGVDGNEILIGIIGRLAPIKNHIMFLKAAKIFLKENPEIKVKFLIVGDGELRDELEMYCERHGISAYVRFCGWILNVSTVYADLDILALTSLNEGTPVSIIEAMASSVPVIATDAGGVLDLLGPKNGIPQTDGFIACERGILCRKNDALGFAKGLNYLLNASPYEKEKITSCAQGFVKGRFSEERLLNDMESLYFELMAKKA